LALLSFAGGLSADPPQPILSLSALSPSLTPGADMFTRDYGQYILTEHDQFKFETTVSLDPDFVRRETEWAPIFFAPGKLLFNDGKGHYTHIGFNMAFMVPDAGSDSRAQTVIDLFFQNRAAAWEHRGDHDFKWLVDGKPLEWIANQYQWEQGGTNQYGNNNCLETNIVQISPALLKQLASAKVIDCRFGSTEFYFGDIQFWILRQFAQVFDGLTQRQGIPNSASH
jgi:hypothetical protein